MSTSSLGDSVWSGLLRFFGGVATSTISSLLIIGGTALLTFLKFQHAA